MEIKDRLTRRGPWLLAGALALIVGVACGGGSATSSAPGGGGTASSVIGAAAQPAASGKAAVTGTPPTADTPIPEGPKVIRTAQVTVRVRADGFDSAHSRLLDRITSAGGYLASEESTQADRIRSATITFKVPSEKFMDTLNHLGELGVVERMQAGGTDVSQDYVDLKARLQSQIQQRDAMNALLARANSIQDIITVRGQLAPIQEQIERLQGRINFLDHATGFSTVTVTVHEPAVGAGASSVDAWGLQTAASQALHNFVSVISFLIVAVGTLAPFGLMAGAGLLLLWWRRPLRRRPLQETTGGA